MSDRTPQVQESDCVCAEINARNCPVHQTDGEEERCGCQRYGEGGRYRKACRFHWNESNIQHELERARSWERRGRLDKDDRYDRQVLRFYDELCYWAAKGIGDAGSVGSIYNAASRRLNAASPRSSGGLTGHTVPRNDDNIGDGPGEQND